MIGIYVIDTDGDLKEICRAEDDKVVPKGNRILVHLEDKMLDLPFDRIVLEKKI